MNKEGDYELIVKIIKRAESMGLVIPNRYLLIMDLDCANREIGLRLEELLNADDFDFKHDVIGIQNNINLEKRKLIGFIPKFIEQ
jgi:hypothetical protein